MAKLGETCLMYPVGVIIKHIYLVTFCKDSSGFGGTGLKQCLGQAKKLKKYGGYVKYKEKQIWWFKIKKGSAHSFQTN